MVNNIPGEKKLSDKLRADKENKVLHLTNKWASWAITKNYSAYPIGQIELSKLQMLSRWAGNKFQDVNEFIFGEETGAKQFLTMSETEKQMRTETVVIAMLKLQDSGQLKITQLEDLDFITALELEAKGRLTSKQEKILKEDKELVKKIARNFVAQTDMQMTTSDVGMYNRAFGGLHTRFTIYTQQKAGHDVEIFKRYWNSMDSDEKKSPLGKKILTLINAMGTFNQKKLDKLWKENPDLVKIRSFMLMPGFMTLLLDLAIFLPGATFLARKVPFLRNTSVIKVASGTTSDVVSLTVSLPLYILFSLMADEDEEDVQNEVYRKLKKIPGFGFGTGVVMDMVYALFSMALDIDEDEKARRVARAINPMLPLPPVSTSIPFVDPAVREISQGLVSD
jgi:hypothetical protein